MQTQSSSSLVQEIAGRAFGMSIGNLFLGFFGMVWILWSLLGAGKENGPLIAGLSCILAFFIAIGIYVLCRTYPLLDRSEPARAWRKKINRQFRWINIFQWTLIFLVVYILVHLKLDNWVLPAIILIVGAHFLPLAKLFKMPVYYVAGTLMVAWAIVYPIVLPPGKGDFIGGIGTGALLWATSIYLIVRMLALLRRINTAAASGNALPNGAKV